MYLLIIITQFFLPYWCQMLRHDVLNGIGAVITVAVYILILRSAEILEALKDVNLILAVHQINRPLSKCRFKFLIIWEAGTFLLRQQRILELFDIVVLCAIASDDLPVQHKEDFIQSVCR